MPDDVEYKGWLIEPQSYKSERDRWRPRELVSIHEGGRVRIRPLTWFNAMYDTEEEANAYAARMAKKWIDTETVTDTRL